MSVEQIILSNLVLNDEYCRKTLPFLKDEYFLDESERVVFKTIKNFVEEFNALPTQDALKIALDKDKNLNESVHQTCVRIINNFGDGEPNTEWLLKESETFCKDKAVYNAIMNSIAIIDGQDTYGDRWNHPKKYPIDECFVIVNHMKWDFDCFERLRQVTMIKQDYSYYFEYKKMYEYLLDNNFKINVKDFMIEDLSDNNSYSYWEDIKQKCIDYRHE